MSTDPLAELLCRADDSMHHHEATDDFPCWHCKQQADVVRAYLASDETVQRAARAINRADNEALTRTNFERLCATYDEQARAALAAATEPRP